MHVLRTLDTVQPVCTLAPLRQGPRQDRAAQWLAWDTGHRPLTTTTPPRTSHLDSACPSGHSTTLTSTGNPPSTGPTSRMWCSHCRSHRHSPLPTCPCPPHRNNLRRGKPGQDPAGDRSVDATLRRTLLFLSVLFYFILFFWPLASAGTSMCRRASHWARDTRHHTPGAFRTHTLTFPHPPLFSYSPVSSYPCLQCPSLSMPSLSSSLSRVKRTTPPSPAARPG